MVSLVVLVLFLWVCVYALVCCGVVMLFYSALMICFNLIGVVANTICLRVAYICCLLLVCLLVIGCSWCRFVVVMCLILCFAIVLIVCVLVRV